MNCFKDKTMLSDWRECQVDRLLYRVKEAAEIMGISTSKLYEMLASGEMPYYIRIRDSIRVPRADLEKWIEEQKETARPGKEGAAHPEGERDEQNRSPRLRAL
jgi:excisionase family DNA binding protein